MSRQYNDTSRHHLLFTRKNYSKSFSHKLRKLFIYDLPDEIHTELHATVPPIPSITEPEAFALYTQYKKEEDKNIFEALEWLIIHSPNKDFLDAVKAQYDFLVSKT